MCRVGFAGAGKSHQKADDIDASSESIAEAEVIGVSKLSHRNLFVRFLLAFNPALSFCLPNPGHCAPKDNPTHSIFCQSQTRLRWKTFEFGQYLPSFASPVMITPPVKVHLKIVGAGFSGLACAVSATRDSRISRISIFDPSDPYESESRGASSAAAGLFHNLSRLGKKMWMGNEGYAATAQLLELVERVSKRRVVQQGVPIVRLGGFDSTPGGIDVEIQGGMVVDPIEYLRGLWEVVEDQAKANGQNVCWEKREVRCWSDLDVDLHPKEELREVTICAMGTGITHLWKDVEPALPVMFDRGRNIVVQRPEGFVRKEAVIRGEYVVPNYGGQRLIIGATHERSPQDSKDAIPRLWATLKQKGFLHGVAAALSNATVHGYTDAVRVMGVRCHLGRLPMIARHPERPEVWAMTGFGGRGLIHHAIVAEMVLMAALAGDSSLVPQEILFGPK